METNTTYSLLAADETQYSRFQDFVWHALNGLLTQMGHCAASDRGRGNRLRRLKYNFLMLIFRKQITRTTQNHFASLFVPNSWSRTTSISWKTLHFKLFCSQVQAAGLSAIQNIQYITWRHSAKLLNETANLSWTSVCPNTCRRLINEV